MIVQKNRTCLPTAHQALLVTIMSTHGSTFFLAGTGTNGLTPSALFVKPR